MKFIQISFEHISAIASVVTIFSFIYAYKEYKRRITNDFTKNAIEQIEIFENIIIKWREVTQKIKLKNGKYKFYRIPIDNTDLLYIKNNYPHAYEEQLNIFFDKQRLHMHEGLDNNILDEIVFFLNSLEGLALKIKHYKTIDHPALSSIHHTFVQFVEFNSVAILFMIQAINGTPLYVSTMEIYNIWRHKTNQTDYYKNLLALNIISEQDMKQIKKHK